MRGIDSQHQSASICNAYGAIQKQAIGQIDDCIGSLRRWLTHDESRLVSVVLSRGLVLLLSLVSYNNFVRQEFQIEYGVGNADKAKCTTE